MRSLRRHHADVAKERARRFFIHHLGGYGADDPRAIGIRARSPKGCSDPYCCGNRRRYGKERLTRSESIAAIREREQTEALYSEWTIVPECDDYALAYPWEDDIAELGSVWVEWDYV